MKALDRYPSTAQCGPRPRTVVPVTTRSASPAAAIALNARAGRWIVAATVTASGVALLDSTVVNVALPQIGADLGGEFSTLQWVVTSYLLTLGSLVLVGGSLGDLIGKRRVFVTGLASFGAASLVCALSPTATALIFARGVQGVAAALLVPNSLAILSASFNDRDRGRAIGLWSGLAGIFTVLGPFVGGVLIQSGPHGWRWIFLINLPFLVLAYAFTRAGVAPLPGRRTAQSIRAQVDLIGATGATLGLGLVVGALIEANQLGPLWTTALVVAGSLTLVGFLAVEFHRNRTKMPEPMLDPTLFRIRSFSAANTITFVVYGALGVTFFLLPLVLQDGLGYSPVAAGAATLPVSLTLILFSARAGALVPRIGARPLLSAGPLIMAAGMLLLARLSMLTRVDTNYWRDVMPAVLVFAVGLCLVVAPVTTTVMSDVGAARSGTASGVNNAVARIAGLIAIAVLPLIAGLAGASPQASGEGSANSVFLSGYGRTMVLAAIVCAVGGLFAWLTLERSTGRATEIKEPGA